MNQARGFAESMGACGLQLETAKTNHAGSRSTSASAMSVTNSSHLLAAALNSHSSQQEASSWITWS